MKTIILDIPIEAIPEDVLPRQLLNQSSAIRFLRLDADGFLFTCRFPREESKSILDLIKKSSRKVKIGPLRVVKEGQSMIRVSGSWWKDSDIKGEVMQKIYSKFKALEQSQCYFVRSPEIHDKSLRITLAGDSANVKRVQKAFNEMDVPYTVGGLSELKEYDGSPLHQLTSTQTRVLRLAHAMGYYDIPRRSSTARLAAMLKMNKGTAGRHLRRAERNVLNSLLE